jgi:hypothetical protein
VGRTEEGLSGGGAPVDQQPSAVAVGQTQSADVERFRIVLVHDVPEAQVQSEAAQSIQPRRELVDLEVAVQRGLPGAAGKLARSIQSGGEAGRRLLEALGDGREVLLVARDEGRVGLRGQVRGQVEHSRGQGFHVWRSGGESARTVGRRR